jgi:four helix bundle protein
MVQSYRGLLAWQKAVEMVKSVYQATKQFPKDEMYGLTSQLRRAVVSVPSNIAEGQGRNSTKEFLHHLSIAYGSLMEVETQLIISGELDYITKNEVSQLLNKTAEVGRLINGLSKSLQHRIK